MPRTTVTNATFDAALAAVPAPYGPLTRTGTATDLQEPTVTPNSNLRVAVRSVPTQMIFQISYEDLLNVQVRDDLMKEAHGYRGVFLDLKNFIAAMNLSLASVNPLTASPELFGLILNALAMLVPAVNQAERHTNLSSEPYSPVTASYTTSGTGATRTFTNTSTGRALFRLWTFGDGTYSTGVSPTKTWTVDGTYVVRLVNIGANGLVTATSSPAIDVP